MIRAKDRVLAALNHEETDRPPVDLGGHLSSGVNASAYARLKRALGVSSGDVFVYDVVQQLAVVEPPVLEALGVDTIELGRGFLLEPGDWKDWELPDGAPCKVPLYANLDKRGDGWHLLNSVSQELGLRKTGGVFFEPTAAPWRELDLERADFADLEVMIASQLTTAVPVPSRHLPLDAAGLALLGQGARALRASTDRAILGLFGGSLFETSCQLFGMETFLSYLGRYPEPCLRLAERLYDFHLARLEKWLSAVGSFLDVVVFADDLGAQTGPLLSPAMYRRLYQPLHAKLWQRAKELSGAAVMLHSCGGIAPLLDDLIAAGLDAVNPVQVSCAGMDPKGLKSRYGDRLCFWGGGDFGDLLSRGTPADAARAARELLKIMRPRGGFVFHPASNLMPDAKPANVIAMFEAVTG